MGSATKIEWCDHTFNPWRGCSKVSPGCAHCYAEKTAKRNPAVLGTWGIDGTRVVASESYWIQPLRWNSAAAKAGVRRRVFCASLADVFEARPDLISPRQRLFELIRETPNLDWLLLTKRPESVIQLWPLYKGWSTIEPPIPNLWLGASVEDQQRADERIPLLLQTPAVVRFLSVEPLLGPVDLTRITRRLSMASTVCGSCLQTAPDSGRFSAVLLGERPIDWVIVGGESGQKARPCDIAWIRSIVRQCREAGVACFVKQLGSNVEANDLIDAADYFPGDVRLSRGSSDFVARVHLRHPKGGDPAEWPEDIRVRAFPNR